MNARLAPAPPFLSAGHLKSIGNLVVYWSWLEIEVQRAIWRLLGSHSANGLIITTHIGLVSLVNMLKMMVAEQYGETSTRYKKLAPLLDQIEPLRIERNNIIHALWKHTKRPRRDAPVDMLKITARGKLKVDTTKRTAEQIRRVTSDVWHLTWDLREFSEAMLPKLRHSSQRRSRAAAPKPTKARRRTQKPPSPQTPPDQPPTSRA